MAFDCVSLVDAGELTCEAYVPEMCSNSILIEPNAENFTEKLTLVISTRASTQLQQFFTISSASRSVSMFA